MESKWRLFLVLFFWGSNITLFPPRPNGLRSTIHVYFISLFCMSAVVSFADSFISFSRSYRSTSAYIKKKKNSILCSPLFGLFICSVVSCRLVKQQCLSQNLCHSVNLWPHRIIRELVFTGVWAFCEKSPKFLAGYEVDVWDRALCMSHICFTPLSWKWDCLLFSPLNTGFTLHYSMLLSPLQQYFFSLCLWISSELMCFFLVIWELWLIHGGYGL